MSGSTVAAPPRSSRIVVELVIAASVVAVTALPTTLLEIYGALGTALLLVGVSMGFGRWRRSNAISTSHVGRAWSAFAIVAVTSFGWAAAELELYFLASAWIFGLYALHRLAGRGALLLAILVAPTTYSLADGIRDYGWGTPIRRGGGLLSRSELDPFTRARIGGGGCISSGAEWMLDYPYNLAVRSATLVFGPASTLYDGPLPDRETALRILQSERRALGPTELLSDVLGVGGRTVHLVPGTGELLARAAESWNIPTAGPEMRVALVEDRLLLLLISSEVFSRSSLFGIDRRTSRFVIVDPKFDSFGFRDLPHADTPYSVARFTPVDGRIRVEVIGHPSCSAVAGNDDEADAALFELRRGRCRDERLGELLVIR